MKGLDWILTDNDAGLPNHIVPRCDLAEHSFDDCWCHPVTNEWGTIVHNAYDQRELVERGLRRVQ